LGNGSCALSRKTSNSKQIVFKILIVLFVLEYVNFFFFSEAKSRKISLIENYKEGVFVAIILLIFEKMGLKD
jgi:hypothetical protein